MHMAYQRRETCVVKYYSIVIRGNEQNCTCEICDFSMNIG